MIGGIDLTQSRRTKYDRCFYWKRDEDKELDEYEYDKNKQLFYAKEVAPKTLQKMVISGKFMFDEESVTIETDDYVDIVADDIVKYGNKMWRAKSVQKVSINKQKQFMSRNSSKTYIQLKG